MQGYQWEEKYSVGIQFIDNQHKEIFRILDQLFESLKSQGATESTIRIFTELQNYAAIHFHKEEFFFRQFHYADSDDHVKGHDNFLTKINDYKADVKAGNLTSYFELINFLKEWIDHHILIEDMKYRECFKRNGLR